VEKEFPNLNVINVKDLKARNGHENITAGGADETQVKGATE
jgi:hypothetical protein